MYSSVRCVYTKPYYHIYHILKISRQACTHTQPQFGTAADNRRHKHTNIHNNDNMHTCTTHASHTKPKHTFTRSVLCNLTSYKNLETSCTLFYNYTSAFMRFYYCCLPLLNLVFFEFYGSELITALGTSARGTKK